MDQVVIEKVEVVPEPSVAPSYEEKALDSGWKPLEEWEGNPEDWVDAKTFNQRGEYMDRIKSQSSIIKKLEKNQSKLQQDFQVLAEHHRKVAEIERAKAITELKQLKKQALDLGDTDKVVDIDDKIDDLKQEDRIAKTTPVAPTTEIHPELTDWLEENPWYETDKALQGAANAVLEDILAKQPSLKGQVSKTLAMVRDQLQEEFPNKFNKRRSPVSDSGDSQGTNSAKSSGKNLAKKLTAEQRQFATTFIKSGALKSYEEYAQQLADIGEL